MPNRFVLACQVSVHRLCVAECLRQFTRTLRRGARSNCGCWSRGWLVPNVQNVAGRSRHALIGTDVDQQVQPAVSLAAFKTVEALVVSGYGWLDTRNPCGTESDSLMHGSDLVEAS